jgi:putative endonuclease
MPRHGDSAPAVGEAREDQARAFLEARGLKLIDRNYRCRGGELDLVMRDGDCLVFVEVRYRRSARFGSAAESVTRGKQQRIALAASHYLQRNRCAAPCRFDVVAITGDGACEWLKDAFTSG